MLATQFLANYSPSDVTCITSAMHGCHKASPAVHLHCWLKLSMVHDTSISTMHHPEPYRYFKHVLPAHPNNTYPNVVLLHPPVCIRDVSGPTARSVAERLHAPKMVPRVAEKTSSHKISTLIFPSKASVLKYFNYYLVLT